MAWARDITQLCFSSNLTGIVADKIEQSFYSVYSYSGIESIEHALTSASGIFGLLITKSKYTFRLLILCKPSRI